MNNSLRNAFAVALLGGAALIVTPAMAQTANGKTDDVEQKAQAAQNNASATLNNTANTDVAGVGASGGVSAPGSAGMASGRTQHVLGEANSGSNAAAPNDAQSQASRNLNQQLNSTSVKGPAGSNMK